MTKTQAKKLAKQIFDLFDPQIIEATNGTNVPPRFIAGLISQEAGKDGAGNIVRSATRFEPAVYAQLVALRDGKRTKSYQGVSRSQIRDASDAALKALATSYEATQIMGWHCINNLHCTIADLRNPNKHFFYTVKLLQLNGFPKNATEDGMDREMRQWNTGKETGKTYHETYVTNARMIRDAYSELEKLRGKQAAIDVIEDDNSVDIVGIVAGGVEDSSSELESNTVLSQQLETSTTVTNTDLSTPVAIVAQQPYNGIGFWATIKRDLGAALGGNLTFQGISTALQNLTGLPEWLAPLVTKLALVVLIGTIIYLIFRLISYAVFRWTEHVRVKLEAEYKADPTKNNIRWVDANGDGINDLNGESLVK